MKALILAAGLSSRFGDKSKDVHKCLFKLTENHTILEHQIKILKQNGINEIYLAVGHGAEKVKQFCQTHDTCKDVKEFIYCPDYATSNNITSLWEARQHLTGESFVCIFADELFHPLILKKALEKKNERKDKITVTAREGDVRDFISITVKDDFVSKICNKIPPEEKYGAVSGVIVFSEEGSRAIFNKLGEIISNEEVRKNYYTYAINELIKESYKVNHCNSKNLFWHDIDNQEELEEAKELIKALNL